MVEGGEDVDGAHEGDGEVAVEGAEADGVAAFEAGAVGEPRHGDDAVAVGAPALAEPAGAHDGEVGDDDIGADLDEVVVADAPAVEAVRGVVGGDDVGGGGEAADDVDALGGVEVEGHGALVGVAVVELGVGVPARFALGLGADVADRVEAVFGLDLDDVGAEVGEETGGEGPGDGPAEVEDAHAGEGLVGIGGGVGGSREGPDAGDRRGAGARRGWGCGGAGALDDAIIEEGIEFGRVEAGEAGQDFLAVLTEGGGRPERGRVAVGEEGGAREADGFAELGVSGVDEEVTGEEVGILGQVLHGVEGEDQQTAGLSLVDEFLEGERGAEGLGVVVDAAALQDAIGEVVPFGVVEVGGGDILPHPGDVVIPVRRVDGEGEPVSIAALVDGGRSDGIVAGGDLAMPVPHVAVGGLEGGPVDGLLQADGDVPGPSAPGCCKKHGKGGLRGGHGGLLVGEFAGGVVGRVV